MIKAANICAILPPFFNYVFFVRQGRVVFFLDHAFPIGKLKKNLHPFP